MAFDDLFLESFIWEITERAAHAVALNLPLPPEERRPVRGIKPLERSKFHRRQWRFPRFRACAAPDQGFLEGTIYGESTVY